jgi:peptidoglycan/xylan/chitin deacetylase (PgdA/CDA1 family)
MVLMRNAVRDLAYATGVLALRHRLRHAATLTVVLFHRVTEPGTPAAVRADPTYAMPAPLFAACLRFFRRHYAVVGLSQVVASLEGGAPLPPRALLITFDDGWADNLEVALPLLQRERLPAVVFVAADVLDQPVPWWWQEILLRALHERRALYPALWAAAGPDAPPDDPPGTRDLALLLRYAALLPAERLSLLTPFAEDAAPEGRHMIGPNSMAALAASGIDLGAHGAAHLPLSMLADPAADLARARMLLPGLDALSIPHGRYDGVTLAAARAAGYRLVFTSDACLNPTPSGRPAGSLLGRISIEAKAAPDDAGVFAPSRLATWLFHRPVRRLDEHR